MGLADEFERRLERVVEGFFSKAFRSKVEPAEIGRRLLREMESGKSVSVAAVYVPNLYTVWLSGSDRERLEGLLPTLAKEFVSMLQQNARERKWIPAGALAVLFETGDIPEGRFDVVAEHDSSTPESPPEVTRPTLVVSDTDPPRRLRVESDRILIGRAEECDLVVADPEVSRKHAEITRKQQEWWITDLGATNGTFINGALVKERQLKNGDRVKIGNAEIEFRAENGESG